MPATFKENKLHQKMRNRTDTKYFFQVSCWKEFLSEFSWGFLQIMEEKSNSDSLKDRFNTTNGWRDLNLRLYSCSKETLIATSNFSSFKWFWTVKTKRTADLISLEAFDDDKCRNDERTMSTWMTKSVRSRGTPNASWDTTSDVNKSTWCKRNHVLFTCTRLE